MEWLLCSIRLRIVAALILGAVIGATGKSELERLGCATGSTALSKETRITDFTKARVPIWNEAPSERANQENNPKQCLPKETGFTHCPKAKRAILLKTVIALVLPLENNMQARLNAGLMLNFGGCLSSGNIVVLTRNPALGGSRKHPRYFVVHQEDLVLR
jgi:hypothetical protein